MKETNKEYGFAKMYRSFKKWEWYKDANTCRVFLHCLLSANHTATIWRGIDIPEGSFISSIGIISDELGISIQGVRTALKHLKSTGEITSKATNKYTLFKVENWVFYQGDNKQSNKELTSKQQTTNKQLTTNKNDKNDKNDKNKKHIGASALDASSLISDYSKNPEIQSALKAWLQMRKDQKKPIKTDRALKTALSNLDKLTTDDRQKVRVIDQSTERCWLTFYPLKGAEVQRPESQMPDWMWGNEGNV